MIDLRHTYGTDENNSEENGTFEFNCEYCGQEHGRGTFAIAPFLYGVFFLVGKDGGYVGMNCPRCMKTLLLKVKAVMVDSIMKTSNSFSLRPSVGFTNVLRYYSSANYFTKRHPALKGFDIDWIETILSKDEELGSVEELVSFYMGEEPHLSEEYLCSHVFNKRLPPMGTSCSVLWFREQEIDALAKIENENRLRVFPRYIHHTSLCEDIDKFCWQYDQYLPYLKDIGLDRGDEVEKLSDMAKRKNDFRIHCDFANILIADPDGWVVAMLEKASETFKNFDTAPFVKHRGRPSHDEMANEVRANFKKEYIQELLFRMSSGFISNYVELAERIDFSYAAVWDLKEKYLKRLYDAAKSPYKRTQVRNTVSEEERTEIEEYEKQSPTLKKIISNDPEIYQIKKKLFQLAQVKATDIDFLLLGETGTGKELFARAIHEVSGRKGQFVWENCAAIPEELFESTFFGHKRGAFTGATEDRKGHFEEADGGTLLLDEIGALNPRFQPKFLRVIQEREIRAISGKAKKVDLKIIYATNSNLYEMVENGNFRLDLHERIKGFTFEIPPLRKRKGDIPLLIEHFVEKYDTQRHSNPDLAPIQVSDDCMDLLKKYEWKGNVRELENVIKKIIVCRLGENDRAEITPSDVLPELMETNNEAQEKSRSKKKLPGNMKFTNEELIACMAKHENNKTHVAKELGVDPKTIRRRWKKLNP